MAGVAALVRSAQPMLSRDGLIEALRTDAQSPFAPLHDHYWGFGIPQAGAAVARALGRVGQGAGMQVQNRLTPLFHLRNAGGVNGTLVCAGLEPQTVLSSGADLFRTRPQVAVAAIANETLSDSQEIIGSLVGGQLVAARSCAPSSINAFASVVSAPPVRIAPEASGRDGLYRFATDFQFDIDHPLCRPQPPFYVDCRVARAWVYVFTTKVSPFPDALLIPLYRVGFDDIWPLRRNGDVLFQAQPCPGLTRDFGYSTSRAEINNLWQNPVSAIGDPCPDDDQLQQGPNTYFYDGQEGYLLDRCPSSMAPCDGLEGRPIGVYLRRPPLYSGEGGKVSQNWALVPHDRLPPAFNGFEPFSEHTGVLNPGSDGLIGYAFPNLDTDQDGLIDGQERLLGLDRLNPDTDHDGTWDGVEWSIHQLPCSNPATAAPGDAVLFRSGFESTFEVCDGY